MGIIWLTGAGKGIGRATALAYARRGDTVAASARTAADLDQLARDADGLAGKIVPLPVDVTRREAMAAAVETIETTVGPIDLVLFCAGTHKPMSAETFSIESFRLVLETNVMGVANGLAAVMPRFIAGRRGHIAVVASVAGYRGLPSAVAYGASKAALIAMCESLRPELERHKVRISLINPGFVKTPLTDKNEFKMPFLIEPETAADRIVRGLDSGRFEITFPKRFTWGLKALRLVPYPLYFAVTRRML